MLPVGPVSSFSSSASNGSGHRQLRVPELDRWQIWVIGCRCDYVGSTTGVPQIADDLLHRRSRALWAGYRHHAPSRHI